MCWDCQRIFTSWSALNDVRFEVKREAYVIACVQVSTTLSIRIDAETKKRLDVLSKRSKSFLAAEAIVAYVQSEEWQLGEVREGIAELESGQEVSHEKVSKWLRSWGKRGETKAPR